MWYSFCPLHVHTVIHSYYPDMMIRNVTKAASLYEFMTNPQGLRYWTNTYAACIRCVVNVLHWMIAT